MTKPSLHLSTLGCLFLFGAAAYEEALMRADERNWCVINNGSPKAIVMGISGKPDQLI